MLLSRQKDDTELEDLFVNVLLSCWTFKTQNVSFSRGQNLLWTCLVCFRDLSEESLGATDCRSSWKAWCAWEWDKKEEERVSREGELNVWDKEKLANKQLQKHWGLSKPVSLPLKPKSVKTELVLTSTRIIREHARAGRADANKNFFHKQVSWYWRLGKLFTPYVDGFIIVVQKQHKTNYKWI